MYENTINNEQQLNINIKGTIQKLYYAKNGQGLYDNNKNKRYHKAKLRSLSGVRTGKVRMDQVGTVQVRTGEVRTSQIRTGQVRNGQVRIG